MAPIKDSTREAPGNKKRPQEPNRLCSGLYSGLFPGLNDMDQFLDATLLQDGSLSMAAAGLEVSARRFRDADDHHRQVAASLAEPLVFLKLDRSAIDWVRHIQKKTLEDMEKAGDGPSLWNEAKGCYEKVHISKCRTWDGSRTESQSA